jgi:mono/diheme cytochrome c family protein
MDKRLFSLLLIIAGVMLVLAACSGKATPAPTQAPTETPTVHPTEVPTTGLPLSGDPLRGGKLYDNWIVELGADVPADLNPQWVAANAGDTTVEESFGCVNCHGFDFNGNEGFPGIMNDAGKDPIEILAILKGSTNPAHDYSAFMDDQALADLALFVSEGVMDTSAVVVDGKPVNGNTDNGKVLFEDQCTDCHGPQALAINFHPDNEPEYPATIANEDPLELLGKLRYGQPGMPDMPVGLDLGWTNQDFANVIAYLQTLPMASPETEGGRIYDEWFAAFGVEAPEGDQPLWKTQTTNTLTGEATWLCEECHGWDYKGVDGVYGSGSHLTGFPGILDAATMTPEELTAWLDGTKNPDHNFSSFMTADDFFRLVAFIQKDVVDKSAFINTDKTIVGGDAVHGKQLFDSVCKVCHGEDGKAINFGDDNSPEYYGTVAADNPWEFFNKATVGVPGETMPAGWNLGWTLHDVIDLMTFAQTLPTK